jgi:hypothetical protein
MTLKTLSAVVVRVIGWLVILEGIKSVLSTALFWLARVMMMRAMLTEPADAAARSITNMSYLSVMTAVVLGLIELGVGWTLIQHSEFFGRIFSKGLEERV